MESNTLKYCKSFAHKSIAQRKKQMLLFRSKVSKQKIRKNDKQSHNLVLNCNFENVDLLSHNTNSANKDNDSIYSKMYSDIEEPSVITDSLSDVKSQVSINSNDELIINDKDLFISDLRNVFLKYKITHVQGDAILHILKSHHCLSYLPRLSKHFCKHQGYQIIILFQSV